MYLLLFFLLSICEVILKPSDSIAFEPKIGQFLNQNIMVYSIECFFKTNKCRYCILVSIKV